MEAKHTPLSQEARTHLNTQEAAYHLNRTSQTLREWASTKKDRSPIQPVRINGRLAWPVADIKRLLGLES